jgi:hypothetical protein
VHVAQSFVQAPAAGEFLWHGDAIELFASGFTPLTGSFAAGSDTGALQVIAVPPGSAPAQANLYLNAVLVEAFDPSRFAARLTSDGYDVELEIPWSELHGTPAPGVQIGFDYGIDVRGTGAASSAPWVQALLGLNAQATSTCAPKASHPSCDDRTWCTPTLL